MKKRDAEMTEVSRETEIVRIENPDDPNQYIMVERVKSIKFKQKDAPIYPSIPARAALQVGSTTYVGSKSTTAFAPSPTDPPEVFQQYADPAESFLQNTDPAEVPLQTDTTEYILNNS